MSCSPTTCAGCRRIPRPGERFLECSFAAQGFHLGGHSFSACRYGYHPRCLTAGKPFTTRLKGNSGLRFPNVEIWPNFVCEMCTVRAQVSRELGHPGDRWLLQLERMRLLDMAHSTAPSTLMGYQSHLRKIRRFERTHAGLRVLPTTALRHPPVGPTVTLAWVELDTSVRVLPARGSWGTRTPVFNSVRQIRSAVSNYASWDVVQSQPDANYFDNHRHHLGPCKVTDTGGYTLFSKGLASRIGNNPRQATALLGRHAANLEGWFAERYRRARSVPDRRRWALAGFAHCVLWLAWLRGGEAFNICQHDVQWILPSDGPAFDLPEGVGAILIRMLKDKTNREGSFDICIAHRCLTGMSAGKWLARVDGLGLWDPSSPDQLFRHPSGQAWTSHFFRHNFLYPGLAHLRDEGDPLLTRFDGSQSHLTFEYNFWSLHCYRRGARTHCQRSQPDRRHKKASKVQVYEHARWRGKVGGEDIDVTYREWTLYDRLRITLLSH